MAILRMGAAAFPVLFVALLLTDANAALRRTGNSGVSNEKITVDEVKDLKADFDAPEGDVSEDSPAEKAGIQAGDVNVKGDGRKVMEPVQILPEEIRDFDIQAEVDKDIRAKLKAEMEKLEKDLNRNSMGKIENSNGSNGKLYLTD
jgi:S1-C subfamily serine protease